MNDVARLLSVIHAGMQFLPGPEGEGIHEDSLESLHMLTHSLPRWAIPAVLGANSLTLLGYNVAGMFVTSELGAVTRTVFESARTLFVWLGDLLLYYTPLGLHGKLGEAWDRSSYLQARARSATEHKHWAVVRTLALVTLSALHALKAHRCAVVSR